MARQTLTAGDKARLTLGRMGISLPWWKATQDAQASTPVAQQAEEKAVRKVRLLGDSLSSQLSTEPPPAPAALVQDAMPAQAAPEPLSATVAPFTAMFWLSDAGWLVVSTAAGQHDQGLPAHAGLAQDLVQAITAAPVTWVASEAMCWPPAAATRASTREEACEVVTGCLARWCDKHPVREVLLLGDALAQWLDVDVAGKPLGIQYLDTLGQRCLALPAWPDGHTAESKRQLWRLMAAVQAQS